MPTQSLPSTPSNNLYIYNPTNAPIVIGHRSFPAKSYSVITEKAVPTVLGTDLILETDSRFISPWQSYSRKGT